MKKFSANYSNTNHNFVFQNIPSKAVVKNKYTPAICIIKNILQRGKPTSLSYFLQEKIGRIHTFDDFNTALPLIDNSTPKWERIIRGDVEKNNFPAKRFFEDLIPKYLSEYKYIQQLIIPEFPVNDITQMYVEDFIDQQVDFYLPQAYLIIEIDGSQHNKDKDSLRDAYTAKYGIKTVRITTKDLDAESDIFIGKIDEIKKRIDKVESTQKTRKLSDSSFISLGDYKKAFNGVDINNHYYLSTAIIRFQLLILELIENGLLKFGNKWNFEIIERDISGFARLAIDDLFIWLDNILKLHKIKYTKPDVEINILNSLEDFSSDRKSIKVDFSLLKRYTDEFQTFRDIIFVRTDYLDEYLFFKSGDSVGKLKFSSFEQYDYFKISTTDLINYKLIVGGKNSDEEPLLFFLWNLFLHNYGMDFNSLAFREGQLPIIVNALSRNDTLGLLPTGSGKSVCYQLSAILQPAISFVVCPIKSLMYDQKTDLDLSLFTRTNYITGDSDGEDRARTQKEFASGKYFFIFISPERFQLKVFRHYFISVNKEFNVAYAVIDEVHCLSEWGHDFRTSYLNLASTIDRFCKNFKYIGLTATASTNVLKDIQVEFGIEQDNVKTPSDYTREELEFSVIDDKHNKFDALQKELSILKSDIGILNTDGNNTKCGIIFTPTVNGPKGCYKLSQELSNNFEEDVRYYSGSVPKIAQRPVMSSEQFNEYKLQVQNDFKNNEFSLLAATKAFGMGINKGNIFYTFHYGIPGSMESLYQEAGRAGRDKLKFKDSPAKCYVLLSKSEKNSNLNQIWERGTTLSKIQKTYKNIKGDINTNLFFFTIGMDVIKDEFKIIKNMYEIFASSGAVGIAVNGRDLGCDKSRTEKAIYRLKQLGIAKDWTISNFFQGGEFEVDFLNFTEDTVRDSMLSTIYKYDKDFSIEKVREDDKYKSYKKILFDAPESYSNIDKYILVLLQWSYDNFAYNRRQSLKNIYENCCDFSDGVINNIEFKTRLENYFKFSRSSYNFQQIADNPNDFEDWFDIFYHKKSRKKSHQFLSVKEQESRRDGLSRYLESYMYNTGLDMVSGLLRLLLDDYDNADGRSRLEGALKEVRNYPEENREIVIKRIIEIGMECDDKNKNLLSDSLYKVFDSKELLFELSDSLNDSFSTSTILESINNRLTKINRSNYAKFKKAG
jgi:ATP-dependent DNA helicase RecQ